MKKLFKSKQGFTLIELLVVIGILAVLAAIAIPSVAGLIDRANKSADNSNAVEMTNAVERFVSEYELYKQDIASGTFKESDLDSAQGRVFNVTGIKNREDVTKFESTGLNGKGVDLDSKYPANEETLKAVVQNYMKTSSSTYEPKQSDMQFWYSPECGKIVVAETDVKSSELDAIAFDDASISTTLDSKAQYDTVQWICLDDVATDNIATESGVANGTLSSSINSNTDETGEIKTFTICTGSNGGDIFEYEEGMTWKEWLLSDYCEISLTIDEHGNRILNTENGNTQQVVYDDLVSYDDINLWRLESVGLNENILPIEYRLLSINIFPADHTKTTDEENRYVLITGNTATLIEK